MLYQFLAHLQSINRVKVYKSGPLTDLLFQGTTAGEIILLTVHAQILIHLI